MQKVVYLCYFCNVGAMLKPLKYLLTSTVLIGLLVGLVFVHKHQRMNALSSLVGCMVYPVLKLQNTFVAPIAKLSDYYRHYTNAQTMLADYQKRIETLQEQLIALQGQAHYYTATQELRNYAHRYDSCVQIVAQILLKNFDAEAHFMLIDAGSGKGVAVGNAVVYKNCLLGRVTQVYPFYSKVLLISDKNCSLGAYCATSGAKGVHEGVNNRHATHLNFVNHLDAIHSNDLVLSVGEGSVFPRGFGLGRISSYTVDEFYYTITLEPLVDIAQLSYCSIIQKGNECQKSTCAAQDPE